MNRNKKTLDQPQQATRPVVYQSKETLEKIAQLKSYCGAFNKWLGLELDTPLSPEDYPSNLMHLPNALICELPRKETRQESSDSEDEMKEEEEEEEEEGIDTEDNKTENEAALDIFVKNQMSCLNIEGIRGALFAGPDIFIAYHCPGSARVVLVASFTLVTTPPSKQEPDIFYSMSGTLFAGKSVVKLFYNANTANLEISKPIRNYVVSRIGTLEPLQTQIVKFHGGTLIQASWFDKLGIAIKPANVQLN